MMNMRETCMRSANHVYLIIDQYRSGRVVYLWPQCEPCAAKNGIVKGFCIQK